jgi:predicted RND superfamily exporter protein
MTPHTESAHPRAAAFVDWTLRWGRAIWVVALLLAIPAVWRTTSLYLHLNSNLEQLLPRESRSVVALDELRRRMPGLQYLGVVVDTGDVERLPAGEKFIDDLAARIRGYPPNLVRTVRIGTTEERSFLESHAPLYVAVEDLRTIRTRIEARRDWEVSRVTGDRLEDEELDEDDVMEDTPRKAAGEPPPVDLSDIEQKYKDKLPQKRENGSDRFTNKDLHLTMLLIEVGGFETGTKKGKQLLSHVKADIEALGGTDAYAHGMRLGFGGDVAIAVEELDALIKDLSLSSVLVVVAVALVLVAYYRWARSVLILVPPLLIATAYAFALASLPPFNVTELNSNTAFLGAIIVGNGINFGIVFLARYTEERRRGIDTRTSLVTAVAGARVGTLGAALGAGVAYASLVSTDFRGFRQFGIVGGIGMLMSWVIAFVCMPALIVQLDRGAGAIAPSSAASDRTTRPAAFVLRHRAAIAAIAVLATVLSMVKVRSFGLDQIEVDVSKLRRRDTWTSGEGYWGGQMDKILSRYLSPIVMLTDSPDEARAVATALRDPNGKPLMPEKISEIRTIEDVLPTDQDAKIAEAAAIRDTLTPRIRVLVAPDRLAELERLLGPEDLRPVTVDDLPHTFTTGLLERDGTTGRSVLVFPRRTRELWEGPPLIAFVDYLRTAARAAGHEPARVAGSLPISADILGSVLHDGVVTSAIALAGVVLVVLVMFRFSMTTLTVLASLAVAVLWLCALLMILDVKINFANFIALPITFGIGVDYAVNVMSRYAQDGRRNMLVAIAATGSAVALCSSTTIIGYSSLLVAQNRALFLFGLVAVLGEICCVLSGVVIMPAVVQLVADRHSRRALSPAGE